MYRSVIQARAPSTAAASRTDCGTLDRPARVIRAISGVHSHTSISTTAAKALTGLPRMSPV